MKLTKEQKEEIKKQKIEDKKDLSKWNKNIARLKKLNAIAE